MDHTTLTRTISRRKERSKMGMLYNTRRIPWQWCSPVANLSDSPVSSAAQCAHTKVEKIVSMRLDLTLWSNSESVHCTWATWKASKNASVWASHGPLQIIISMANTQALLCHQAPRQIHSLQPNYRCAKVHLPSKGADGDEVGYHLVEKGLQWPKWESEGFSC